MSDRKTDRNNSTPKHGSLWAAVIETEPEEERRNASECVGDLVGDIEALDDDPACGPAVGVGMGSPRKVGGVYWLTIRKLFTDAIDKLDWDGECARLIGK